MDESICESCGAKFKSAPRKIYCTKKCRQRRYNRIYYLEQKYGTIDNFKVQQREWILDTHHLLLEQTQKKLKRKQKQNRHSLKLKRTQAKKYFLLQQDRYCAYCGVVFKSDIENQKYCTTICTRRFNNKKYKRKKKGQAKIVVDTDISLPKLFKRDQGNCYLCNTPCDYSDHHIDDTGAFIVGKFYPSIDHVKPTSKGGLHSWNNVKLTHHYCNIIKSDENITKLKPPARD